MASCAQRVETSTSCRRVESEGEGEGEGEGESVLKCVRLVKRWKQCRGAEPELVEEKREEFESAADGMPGASSTTSTTYWIGRGGFGGLGGGIFGERDETRDATIRAGDEDRLLRELRRLFGSLRDIENVPTSGDSNSSRAAGEAAGGRLRDTSSIHLVHEDDGGIFSRLLSIILTPPGWTVRRRRPDSAADDPNAR